MRRPQVLVITGPTATGKTLLGINVAQAVNGEIVSADSMQIYKHMDIGTAKPTKDEMRFVTHHMIDIVSPFEDYSVARYVREAEEKLCDILSKGKLPVIVGGSGLYIDSLILGRTFTSRSDSSLRKTIEARYDSIGGDNMLSELRKIDKASADKLFPNDKKRIVRAFEAIEGSGKPISLHDEESKAKPVKYDYIKVALSFADRSVLYDTINKRVDLMIANGLEQEVLSLIDMGVSRSCTSMQAIGYKEMLEAILGETDIKTAIEKIKMESRRLSKRQLTWLRRDDKTKWIIWEDVPDIKRGFDTIVGMINEKK